MPEISAAELTTIENALVTVRQALEEDSSPQADEIKKMLVEAEQITSGKLDEGNQTEGIPAGTSGIATEQQLAGGAEASMDDAQQMMMHMQEAMKLMQKMMGPPTGAQGQEMTMEECMASGKSQEECQAMMMAPA